MAEEETTILAARHGKYITDAATAEGAVLTEAGEQRAGALGDELATRFAGRGLRLRVLSSASVRAKQLGDIVGRRLGVEREFDDWLTGGPKGRGEAAIDALIVACDGADVLVACGHDPMLAKLMYLAIGDEAYERSYGINAVLEFTLNRSTGTLTFVKAWA